MTSFNQSLLEETGEALASSGKPGEALANLCKPVAKAGKVLANSGKY